MANRELVALVEGTPQLAAPTASDVSILVSPLDISALTAGQIKFPVTQNASADANTLDDYEEGTWTGALIAGTSGTITLSGQFVTGYYQKVGNRVHVQFFAAASSIDSPVGALTVTGLPFTSAAHTTKRVAGSIRAFDTSTPANTSLQLLVAQNQTAMVIEGFSVGALVAAGYVKATSTFNLELSYMTD